MKSFRSSVRIRATADRIWSTLMETTRWPEFDSSIVRVEGTPSLGSKVTVHSKIGRAFPLTVAEFAPHRRMVLAGGMPLGLFKGARTYTIDPHADGTTEFTMQEEFSGLLAPLITRSIPDMQPSFDAFASNLKKRVEQGG